MSNNSNERSAYLNVQNKQIGCTFCGSTVRGRVVENTNPQTKKPEKHVHWNCDRCGNRVKIGKLAE
jgi:hypothetical protein